MPKVLTKTKFAGTGALVQLAGVVIAIFATLQYGDIGLLVGGIAGLLLLVIGSSMSKSCSCSACGNTLASKKVTLCPTCHADFR